MEELSPFDEAEAHSNIELEEFPIDSILLGILLVSNKLNLVLCYEIFKKHSPDYS